MTHPANTVSAIDRAELVRRGVKFLMASYVDIHGVAKCKMVPIDHYDQMMRGSELFTGAALDGVPQDVSEEEVAAHPDPASCRILPWAPDVAWFASDLWNRGKPFEAGARNILNRQLARLEPHGYRMNLGMEAEFFVLRDTPDGGYAPLSDRPHLEKPAYDAVRLLDNKGWIGELVDAMNELGWGVYSFDHEDGIAMYILEYENGFRAMSCDDVWAVPDGIPARKGSGDIGINWRVEGTAGLARGTIGWPEYPSPTPSTIDFSTTQSPGIWYQPRWKEVWFPDAFVGTMAQLLCALEDGTEPEIGGADNLNRMGLGEACYRSAREHRAVEIREITKRK